MRAINHALTGAVIGLATGNPAVAVPVAFASHFVCDAIPHYGLGKKRDLEHSSFTKLLVADAILCVLLVAVLAGVHRGVWLTASFSAFAAASPDFMWIKRFLRQQKGQSQLPRSQWNIIMRFHSKIQWYERPPGAYVEVVWLVAGVLAAALWLRAA